MKIDMNQKKKVIFIKNFIGGLGWMIGATIGFALFVTFLSFVLNWAGGLPVIGDFAADLIEMTNQSLETKKTLLR